MAKRPGRKLMMHGHSHIHDQQVAVLFSQNLERFELVGSLQNSDVELVQYSFDELAVDIAVIGHHSTVLSESESFKADFLVLRVSFSALRPSRNTDNVKRAFFDKVLSSRAVAREEVVQVTTGNFS